MGLLSGSGVYKRKVAIFASACCFFISSCAISSCSATSGPPPPKTTSTSATASKTTSASAAPAAPPTTAPLESGWKSYGGTAYFGCPQEFSTSKSALDIIRPKVFDTKGGIFVAPAFPVAATGENITGAVCALAGNADDMKVVYLITTLKPARLSQPEVVKTLAYVFDMKSGQALVTKEM